MKHEERIPQLADRETSIRKIYRSASFLPKEVLITMLAIAIFENKRPDLSIEDICDSIEKLKENNLG